MKGGKKMKFAIVIIWLIALSVGVLLQNFQVPENTKLVAELSKANLGVFQRQQVIMKVQMELIRENQEIMELLGRNYVQLSDELIKEEM